MENIEGDASGVGREEEREEEARAQADESAVASSAEEARSRLPLLAGGAVVIGVVFSLLQFSTRSICCGDYDGYYHVGWSRMLWEGLRSGLFPPPFTQLPLTTLNPRDYVDHHFLFHILQIPAQWFGDPVTGAKVLTALFAAAAVFACYWLTVRYRLRYPVLWLLALLACSAPFLYRMNMAKAMSVSIVLLVAGLYLLFERKYLLLLPLAFVFALTYDLWLLLGVGAVAWAAAVSWSERRVEWRAVVACGYVAAGGLMGYVINPYFPHNLELLVEHVLMKVTSGEFSTAVGGEWYPYTTWEFWGNSSVACVATVVGYVAFDWRERRTSARALCLLLFSTALLLVHLRWKRFAEYWPPFAVLFAAFCVQAAVEAARNSAPRLPSDVLDELQPYLDHGERPSVVEERRRERWAEALMAAAGLAGALLSAAVFQYAQGEGAQVGKAAAGGLAALAALCAVGAVVVCFVQSGLGRGLLCVVALALGITAATNIRVTADDIAGSAAPDHYRGGIEWLKANVAPGEMIFNTDWDDFPRLFYFAPEFRYVSGLDPTYLQDQNPELHKLYEEITTGRTEDPGPPIRERFNARYVFTDNQHEDFVNLALDSGWFDEPVYEDEHCTILRLRDTKGTPPPAPETDEPEEEAQEP